MSILILGNFPFPVLQRADGHRGGCQGHDHGNVPDVPSVGDGDPPGRNQGPYEKYDGHDGLKTVYRTHRSGNFVLVHLIEVSAFLFVEFVIHHSDSGRDEQHAYDQIEHIHAVGARHPPIDIGPEPPQRADQKNEMMNITNM